MPKLMISQKLPLAVVGTALILAGAMGLSAYWISYQSLQAQIQSSLTAAVETAADELTSYLGSVALDLRLFSSRPDAGTAIENMGRSLSAIAQNSGATALLREAYTKNTASLLKQRGYGEVYLFNPAGDLVYTSTATKDFGSNFVVAGSPFSDTALGDLVRRAMTAKPGTVLAADFAPYPALDNQPVGFVASPIYKKENLAGVMNRTGTVGGSSSQVG